MPHVRREMVSRISAFLGSRAFARRIVGLSSLIFATFFNFYRRIGFEGCLIYMNAKMKNTLLFHTLWVD